MQYVCVVVSKESSVFVLLKSYITSHADLNPLTNFYIKIEFITKIMLFWYMHTLCAYDNIVLRYIGAHKLDKSILCH